MRSIEPASSCIWGAGRPLLRWISRKSPSTENGVTSSGIWNRQGDCPLGPGSELPDRDQHERETSRPPPTHQSQAYRGWSYFDFERDLRPDLGEIGVDVTLIDHLGAVDLGGRRSGMSRAASPGSTAARNETSQVRSESIRVASLSGSNFETESP